MDNAFTFKTKSGDTVEILKRYAFGSEYDIHARREDGSEFDLNWDELVSPKGYNMCRIDQLKVGDTFRTLPGYEGVVGAVSDHEDDPERINITDGKGWTFDHERRYAVHVVRGA